MYTLYLPHYTHHRVAIESDLVLRAFDARVIHHRPERGGEEVQEEEEGEEELDEADVRRVDLERKRERESMVYSEDSV
jgi:hypothetical protein